MRSVSFLQAKAGITKEILEHMERHSKELSKGRKKRVMPAGLASPQEMETLSLISSHPLHKSTKVCPHIRETLTCVKKMTYFVNALACVVQGS